jgi:hypothetical protein
MKVKEGVLFRSKVSVKTDKLDETKMLYKFVPNIKKDDETALANVVSVDGLSITYDRSNPFGYELETHNKEMVYMLGISGKSFSQPYMWMKTKQDIEKALTPYRCNSQAWKNSTSIFFDDKYTGEEDRKIWDLLKQVGYDSGNYGRWSSLSERGSSLYNFVKNDSFNRFLCYTLYKEPTKSFWGKEIQEGKDWSFYRSGFEDIRQLVKQADARVADERETKVAEYIKYTLPKTRKAEATKAEKEYKDYLKEMKALGWTEKVITTERKKK